MVPQQASQSCGRRFDWSLSKSPCLAGEFDWYLSKPPSLEVEALIGPSASQRELQLRDSILPRGKSGSTNSKLSQALFDSGWIWPAEGQYRFEVVEQRLAVVGCRTADFEVVGSRVGFGRLQDSRF